jgi:RNA polymerase sigma-70 factor (ECF subfamily)
MTQPQVPPHAIDELAAQFDHERRRLRALAWRLVGSEADADEIVQDAWLELTRVQVIGSVPALATTLVTRRSIDHLRSARVRRESYVGPWLPEPEVETWPDALLDVPYAVACLFERLEPLPRAVFVLREAFGLDPREVGAIIGRTEAATRQIHRRARSRLGELPVLPPEGVQSERLTRFLMALHTGDPAAFIALLAEDAVAVSDGGGEVRAALRPIFGAERVTRFWLGMVRRTPPFARVTVARIAGETVLVVWNGDALAGITWFDWRGARLERTFTLVSPRKLRAIAASWGVDVRPINPR